MPHSPLTRFLAILIVIAFAVVMFWPEESAYTAAGYSLGGLLLALGIFTWIAVRGAPPFDDHAFHRSLPPGDGTAFRNVLGIHLLMIGGFVLIVWAYCYRYGFGWRTISYGAAAVTFPALAFISILGIVASVSSARQHWRFTAWATIVLLPLLCIYWVRWARTGLANEWWEDVYFPPVRTMVLTAAGLYPLIWWLVAVRRRKALGLVFGAATGALLPWLFVYGYFVPVPASRLDPREGADNPHADLQLVRKTIPENSGPWLPLSELFEVKGLGEGEFAGLDYLSMDMGPEFRGSSIIPVWELQVSANEPAPDPRRVGPIFVTKSNGHIIWGEQAIWNHLRSRIPAVESFGYWSIGRSLNATLALSKPGRDVSYTGSQGQGRYTYKDRGLEPMMDLPWAVSSSVRGWDSIGVCSLKEGGSFRIKGGGTLKVLPLATAPGGLQHLASFKIYDESLTEVDGPWFGSRSSGNFDPYEALRVLMVDSSGRHAFALDTLGPQFRRKILLGGCYEWTFGVRPTRDPEEMKRDEMMNGARLHFFLPKLNGAPRSIAIPPP